MKIDGIKLTSEEVTAICGALLNAVHLTELQLREDLRFNSSKVIVEGSKRYVEEAKKASAAFEQAIVNRFRYGNEE